MKSELVWQRRILPNGAILLLYPRKSALTTQIGVAIKYGANLDPDSISGRAHFLEHMVSGGSDRRIALSRRVEFLGGLINFETNHEYTYNYVNILPEKIIEASEILSELLFDSNFEEDKFELERKIILNELDQVLDNPSEKIEQMFMNCLYKTHPIRREILGSRRSLNYLSINDIIEAHNLYYNISNMILIITGKFNEKDIDLILNAFLSRSKTKSSLTKPSFYDNSNPKRRKEELKSGISQTFIKIGTRTISKKHFDAPILDLIATILGSGFSSRLFIEVREKLGLSYNLSTTNQSGLDYGFFSVDCSMQPKNLEVTLEVIEKELRKICKEKIKEKELKKAKDIIRGEILRLVDMPSSFSSFLASCEIKYKTEYAILDYLTKINDASSKDIFNISNKYLRKDNLSLAILSPKVD